MTRLQVPMRLLGSMHLAAEHDDHLAKARLAICKTI
jgi:hypothetical protein